VVLGQRLREPLEAFLDPAAEDLQEEVVHRPEVVVHELGGDARLLADPARRHRGVALRQ
jgi:hypothetical protein